MKLLIIRHGAPNYALDTLTEKGWQEAEALAVSRYGTEGVRRYAYSCFCRF